MANSRNRPEGTVTPPPFPRLYAILDVGLCEARDLQPSTVLRAWLDAGVRLVQLRAKHLSFGPFLRMADEMAATCGRAGAIFIVNDRLDVARLSGADGVHLGQDDLTPDHARVVWPDARWIGLSTHTPDQMAAGLRTAATYLAIGPVFATATKEKASPIVGLGGVRRAAHLAGASARPLVAIGGLTLATAADVMAAGAGTLAVISDLLSSPDPRTRAREWVRALEG